MSVAQAQTIAESLTPSVSPRSIVVNPTTNRVYLAGSGTNANVFDPVSNTNAQLAFPGTAVALNADTNKIYFANGYADYVTVLDGATNATLVVPCGHFPDAVAVNTATNKIYVANHNDSSVTVIDGATNLTTTVGVGVFPTAVEVNEASNKIYVVNAGSGSISVINGSTNTVASVLQNSIIAGDPIGLSVNQVTNRVYVANGQNVFALDGSTDTVVATITVPLVNGAIAINTVTNKIYVSCTQGVFVIDGPTNLTDTVSASAYFSSIAVDATTNKIYAANFAGIFDTATYTPTGSITIIDGATDASRTLLIPTAPFNSPYFAVVNPVTDKIYVGSVINSATRSQIVLFTVIDGASPTVTSIPTGTSPTAVTVNQAANQSFVLNSGGSSVTVINGANQSPTTISLPSSPLAIAANPITNKAYISTQGSNSVTVLDGSSNTTSQVTLTAPAGAVAANPATNTIYLTNPSVSSGQISVLNGASNAVTTLSLGAGASAAQDIAVNAATNKIYVETATGVVVVDGASGAVTNVPVAVGAGAVMGGLAVNAATNKIYVVSGSSVTVIDGATNTATSVAVNVGTAQYIQLNAITNKIYVAGSGAGLAVIDGATNNVTAVTTSAPSSGLSLSAVSNKVYDITGANLTVLDGATNTVWTLALSGAGTGLGVNPVTSQIYVSIGTAKTVQIFSELNPQVSPLTVAISSLPGNQTASTTPSFTFTAQSSNALPPTGVYYQVDSWQNSWTAATGSNPSFTATLGTLSPGVHTLYAYAVDGEESTNAQVTSPIIGSIQAYTFVVTTTTTTVTPPPVTTTGATTFVTAQTPGALRNNYSGFVGFAFTTGSSALQVTSLGRFAAPGNTGSHLLKLVGSNGTDVSGGSVSVSMSGATTGQYQYATLSSPITLTANTSYYLVSAETSGADQWYDIGGVTSTSDASVTAPVYSYGTNAYYAVPGLTGKAYVPVNFQFTTTTAVTPPPVTPPPATTTSGSFVTAQTPGALRNNYGGFVGFAFTTGSSSLQVSSLGRYAAPGNTGSHLVKLVASNGTDVTGGSVTVSMSGATAGQYQYGTLSSPVTLAANTTYYLVSAETAGGDQWYDIGGVTSTSDASVTAPVYSYGPTSYYAVPGLTGKAYVPVNFQYQTTTTTPGTPPATTGTGTALFTSQTPGPQRNNYSGFVGTAIQVGATPLTVTSLGRFFAAGNTGTHTLKLVQSTGVDVAGGSVSVSLAGGTAGQYTYAALASLVTLQANTTYYLLSQETSGGDFWYDLGPVTSTGAAQVSGAVYSYGSTNYAVAPGTAGYSYVPVNLLYQ